MGSIRRSVVVLVVLLVATLLGSAPGGAAPPGASGGPPGVGAAEPPRTVTLITGDQVVVTSRDGEPSARVIAAAGRERIPMSVFGRGDSLTVLPGDAARLVASGRLDQRLFEVNTLLGFGFGDDRRSDTPVIVQSGRGRAGVLIDAATAAGAPAPVALPAARATGLRVPKTTDFWASLTGGEGARALAAPEAKVWLDGIRQPTLDRSVAQIGAPAAWAQGLTGAGMPVAVLDTGIDSTHPDLADAVVARRNFTEEPDDDLVGHGTHVASTVTGSGAASQGRLQGAAPDAPLLDGKVCEAFGCPDSAILAGMQWAAESGARVINMSLGGPDTPDLDPLEQAVNDLTAQFGTLFVISAGNDGRDRSIGSPGSADAALTVGAVDRDDRLADFSSRGPTVGDGALKPDITAPGVGIVAANAANGFLGVPGEPYTTLSGTSMAAPHVAGAAAIVRQQHPEWSPERVKAALMGSAQSGSDVGVFAQGAGRVDVASAVDQQVISEPASVSVPLQQWPHDDDVPTTSSITYRNLGDTLVALDLTLDTDAPDGVFRLSADEVEVPAGGTATVNVITDTTTDAPDGFYGARVIATGGGAEVVTPVGVDKEVESYDLTLRATDHTGAPVALGVAFVQGLDNGVLEPVFIEGGQTAVRVPAGRYDVQMSINTPTDDNLFARYAILSAPSVSLDRDTAVDLDARLAQPVNITFARPGPVLSYGSVTSSFRTPNVLSVSTYFVSTFDGVGTAHIGRAGAANEHEMSVLGTYLAAAGDPPSTYDVAYSQSGRLFTGLRRVVRDRDLAAVPVTLNSSIAGQQSFLAWVGLRRGWFAGFVTGLDIEAPARYTAYLLAGDHDWSLISIDSAAGPDGEMALRTVTEVDSFAPVAGGRYPLQLGGAVAGPALPRFGALEPDGPRVWAGRFGNTMYTNIPLFSDGAGNPGHSFARTPERTALYRDGRLVGETPVGGLGFFEVPGRDSLYRLEASVDRSSVGGLSTVVSAVWSFRSARTSGESALPLSVVRFAPRLAADNTAVAGSRLRVPVSVQLNPGAQGVSERLLTVEVSFDDGANWVQAPVRSTSNGGRVVVIDHPTAAGFVSLRATATDTAGNSVEQTILRAYATR